MAFSVFPWKNKGEAEPTKLNRQNLNAAEEALAAQVTSGAIPLPSSVASGSAVTVRSGVAAQAVFAPIRLASTS